MITGFGMHSYILGLDAMLEILEADSRSLSAGFGPTLGRGRATIEGQQTGVGRAPPDQPSI